MKIEEDQPTTRKVTVAIKCDYCDFQSPNQQDFIMLSCQYHDWGNDSHESREERDACPKHLKEMIEDFKNEFGGHINGAEISIFGAPLKTLIKAFDL